MLKGIPRILPPELLKLIYQIKGADRICMVTDSMRGAGMGEGPSVLGRKGRSSGRTVDGAQQVPATSDHPPHERPSTI